MQELRDAIERTADELKEAYDIDHIAGLREKADALRKLADALAALESIEKPQEGYPIWQVPPYQTTPYPYPTTVWNDAYGWQNIAY